MFDSLFPFLLSGLALGLSTAGLFAFAHRAQEALALSGATKPSPKVSAVWAVLVAALLGLVYGNSWPHIVVLAIGGALFVSGWIREQPFLKWSLTVIFFGSVSISVPSIEKRMPVRFSPERFGDPMLLLGLLVAVGFLVMLFRFWPRYAPREIGAATPRLQRGQIESWRVPVTFALALLAGAHVASAWPAQRPDDAEFLAAAPLGVAFGIGLSCVLLAVAQLEAAYRGLDVRGRENRQLVAVAVLGAAFLALLGIEFRLLGPALFIGYIAAAGILVANPDVTLMPPKLATLFPKPSPQPTPTRSGR